MQKTAFVGLSGGVDSSASAYLLKQQGFSVVGVFIKVWQPEFVECNWEAERVDAMRVCAHLDIPFFTVDFSKEYKERVVEYMIAEYAHGRTPNPDVMCNDAIKFGVFFEYAHNHGADVVATGHYAQIVEKEGEYELLRGIDPAKDQSYFLWRVKK